MAIRIIKMKIFFTNCKKDKKMKIFISRNLD